MKNEVIESKYVVLDVETNGLSSLRDDLLSLSIFKPDDNKKYDRFLPLELNKNVYTTHINGITKKDLKDAKPLTQEDVDWLIKEFELDIRIILTYGSIDEKFIRNYFKRKNINGFDKLNFYNFKHDIISSKFSDGLITKDNLCLLYGIDNVNSIHSGMNDCILEWKLFKKMNGNKLLITHLNVFEYNDDYIVPVSYLCNYPNFKYHIKNLSKIDFKCEIIKKIKVNVKDMKKFETNISGITIEHLINSLLGVTKIDSSEFLMYNKSKLKFIGRLPSPYNEIYVNYNSDGTISSADGENEEFIKLINDVTNELKQNLAPVIKYISKNIFHNKLIYSQELIISEDKKVLALCDLSTEDAVLEIKTSYNLDVERFKEQLYYCSKGRQCYLLQVDWKNISKGLTFIISKVDVYIDDTPNKNSIEYRLSELNRKINNNIEVREYISYEYPIKLKCRLCGYEWERRYTSIVKNPICPNCNPQKCRMKRVVIPKLTEEEKKIQRANYYYAKINSKSNGKISCSNYINAKEKVTATCLQCGYVWDKRADKLLEKTFCPNCKK